MSDKPESKPNAGRRKMLLGGTALSVLGAFGLGRAQAQQPAPTPPAAGGRRPNILVIFGDDIGLGTSASGTRA